MRNVIWSNQNLDYEKDWKEFLEAEYPELSEFERMSLMYEQNQESLEDERISLNIQLSTPILAVGDLGLWHGRVQGYKIIDSGNIRDCLRTEYDFAEWYVDGRRDLRACISHHDGTNYYLYRAIKETATEAQIDALCSRIYNGEPYRAALSRLTYRLGDEIGRVYGWESPQRSKSTLAVAR